MRNKNIFMARKQQYGTLPVSTVQKNARRAKAVRRKLDAVRRGRPVNKLSRKMQGMMSVLLATMALANQK